MTQAATTRTSTVRRAHPVIVRAALRSYILVGTVSRTVALGTVVKMISGNNQTGTIASPVAAPLIVQILNGITPIANVPVIFKVTQNDATLQPGAPQSNIVIVNTDATGLAHANLTLGNRAGAGNNVIEAYSTGATGIAVFTASGTPQAPSLISVDSGNNQFGAINQPLVLPLVAVVTDTGFNRLAGIPVTFMSKQGFGTFNNASSFETLTDSDGRAAAHLTLGTQPGQDNNVIEAYVSTSLTTGNLGYPAAFTASGKQPGDPLNTRISGIVQDNSGQPIPAVTMRLYQANLGTHNNEQTELIPPVITDATGHFTLTAVPVGLFKLMADGKTAITTGKNYPTLEYDIVTVAGQDNTLGMPIYLPALDPLSTLCVDQTTGGTLTLPSAPGFALTIQPGAATFPGGAKSGCVSVTPVNPDKMPMAPGFGQQPRYIVTIQPVGTSFNPPAAMTIPNLDGLLPRAKTEMYSYDHDLAAFVAIGSATVSADGSTIASDPGIGVMKAGWHCGGNPNTTGSVGTCPTCKKCSGSSCVPNDGGSCDDGKFCTVNDVCSGGSCSGTPKPDQTGPSVTLSVNLDKVFVPVNEFLRTIFGPSAPNFLLQITGAGGTINQCCELKKSIESNITGRLAGTGGIKADIPMFGVVNLPYNLGSAGIVFTVGLSSSGTLGVRKDKCAGVSSGSLSGQIQLTGTLKGEAKLPANIVGAAVGGTTGLSGGIVGVVTNDTIDGKFNGGFNGIVVSVKVSFLDGTIEETLNWVVKEPSTLTPTDFSIPFTL